MAEICNDLNPLSPFPGPNFKCFKDYYFAKYKITVKNLTQPLLDVDHTSGRLNFLTPRYEILSLDYYFSLYFFQMDWTI